MSFAVSEDTGLNKLDSLVPRCPVCKSPDVKINELISKRKIIIQIFCFACKLSRNIKFPNSHYDRVIETLRKVK